MLAEDGVKVAARITMQMLSKLAGHTFNESMVEDVDPRLYPIKRNKKNLLRWQKFCNFVRDLFVRDLIVRVS